VRPHNFEILRTEFGVVKVIESLVFADERGFFYESWRQAAFDGLDLQARFVQDNQSLSWKGVVRGLHWQGGASPQGKLIRCVRGRIWDVVVDIRAGSPTFGRSFDITLEEPSGGGRQEGSAQARNAKMVYIPPGFAHGFLTLSDSAVVEYKCTAPWSGGDEGCLRWDDPDLGIRWPLEGPPILSVKDSAGMNLAEYKKRPAFRFGEPA